MFTYIQRIARKTTLSLFLLYIAIFGVGIGPLIGQPRPLTLEDIFRDNTYAQRSVGPFRWMKDNDGYSTLEKNPQSGGYDIVRYDARSGKRAVVVAASRLIPEGTSKPLAIAGYEWSADDG